MQGNSKPSNPYYDYHAVHDLSMFFGRQDELRTLYNAIEKRQCLSIVGSRRIGKSSLLKYLGVPEVQQRYGYELHDRIFIFTDWREHLQKTREDFFCAVCEQIVSQSQPLVTLQLSSLRGEERFKKVLEDIRRKNFRPVLLMDAFVNVTKNPHFDPEFFSFLRSLAGIYDLISYVTASIKPLYEVCHSDAVASSPFFNIFLPHTLGPLTTEETRELIMLPAQRAGHAFTPEEVEWILTQAGQHPFFVQVTCRHLFEEKLRQNNGKVDLKQLQEHIYHELLPHFDNVWSDLNEKQKRDFKLEEAQHAQLRRKLPELSESLLFRKRIHEISHIEAPTITVEDVKNALDKLSDNSFLENCQLSKMHYILLRARSSGSSPAIKKGMLVRDFLKAAFERMRPGDTRNDSESEWRLYNTLWYHYFKYPLPNKQAAARMGLSIRQFYRDREKAIEALLQELLEMEADAMNREEA